MLSQQRQTVTKLTTSCRVAGKSSTDLSRSITPYPESESWRGLSLSGTLISNFYYSMNDRRHTAARRGRIAFSELSRTIGKSRGSSWHSIPYSIALYKCFISSYFGSRNHNQSHFVEHSKFINYFAFN